MNPIAPSTDFGHGFVFLLANSASHCRVRCAYRTCAAGQRQEGHGVIFERTPGKPWEEKLLQPEAPIHAT